MRTLLLCLLFAGPVATLWSQNVLLSPTQFLAGAADAPAVRLEERTIDYLKQTPQALPWVDDVEIRTETHDFDLDEQEFLLRLSPNSPGQRRTQRSFVQADLQNRYQDRQWRFVQALRQRYDLLLEVHYLRELLPLQARLLALARDKVTALRIDIRRGDLDLRDLVDAEDDLHKLELDSLETEQQFRATLHDLTALAPGADSVRIEPGQLIQPGQLSAVWMNWKADSINGHPQLARSQSRIGLAQRAYERELADTRQVLDFVQIRYGGRNQAFFRELLSIGVAFRLPLKGNDRIDLNELQVERLEEENNYQLLKTDFMEQSRRLTETMEDLLHQFEFLSRRKEESQAAFAVEQYRQRVDIAPMTLLALEESLSKRDLILLRLRYRLLRTYLDWLDHSGKLATPPMTNYLSATLEQW